MVSANKLLHFFEAFSTPWFLYCNETNHHLIFYLLEIFNNIIQYQFDGNSNLIYQLLRKRHTFHQLANLPTDYYFICKSLNKPEKKLVKSQSIIDCEDIEYAMHNCDLIDSDNKKLLKRSNSMRSKKAQIDKANKSMPSTPVNQQSLIDSLKEHEIKDRSKEKMDEVAEENDRSSDVNGKESKIDDQQKTDDHLQNDEQKSINKNQTMKKTKEKKDASNQLKEFKPTPEW